MPESNTPVRLVGRPFPPGVSGNPGGRAAGYAEVRELARTMTPRAVERLGELVESDNGKVSIAACVAVFEIGYGRIGAQKTLGASDPTESTSRIDLGRLNADEFRQFRDLAMKARAQETP